MLLTIELPDALVADALELAAQGPLKRWARSVQMFPGAGPALELRSVPPEKQPFHWPLGSGKWVFTEHATGNHLFINRECLVLGGAVLAARYPSAFLPLLGHERRVTGEDGDVLIQCAVFGGWKYKPSIQEKVTVRP